MPSTHWEFSISILKLKVKVALEMSGFFNWLPLDFGPHRNRDFLLTQNMEYKFQKPQLKPSYNRKTDLAPPTQFWKTRGWVDMVAPEMSGFINWLPLAFKNLMTPWCYRSILIFASFIPYNVGPTYDTFQLFHRIERKKSLKTAMYDLIRLDKRRFSVFRLFFASHNDKNKV